jgi:hypothetical protein
MRKLRLFCGKTSGYSLFVLAVVSIGGLATAQEVADVTIDPSHPGPVVARDFVGVSYETAALLPDAKGVHYFSPDNKALIGEFKALGIRSLRVGGSSVDQKKVAIPGHADIDALFGFARAAGVKVLYCLRLKEADPQSDAEIAGYIQGRYADALDCFAIGNEPSGDYGQFHEQWKKLADAILAAAPQAKLSGPGINPKALWSKQFIADFADSYHISLLSGHLYAGGCAYKNPKPGAAFGTPEYASLIPQDAAASRARMLSPSWYVTCEKDLKGLRAAVEGRNIPFRLEETNSYWFGGLKDASDTYAAAIWGLEYCCWWSSRGAAGLNFHTGDMVSGPIPCQYAVFVTSSSGYSARPLAYGMKAFSLAAEGSWIAATMTSPTNPNLSAYATLSNQQTLDVILLNKAFGPGAAAATIHLHVPAPHVMQEAKAMLLRAAGDDIAVKSGITLGGAPIADDASWDGKWSDCPPATDGALSLDLPPASAAIVRCRLR